MEGEEGCRARIVLIGKSNKTSKPHSEALLCVNSGTCCVSSEQRYSLCQKPVVLIRAMLPSVGVDSFLTMFTRNNSTWGNVQTAAVSLGKYRRGAGEGL